MQEHIEAIPDKCRACRRCEVACIAAHHGMSFKEAMKHRDELVSRVQVVKTDSFKTTVRCHQCVPAPCCSICPTGALQQEDNRIVVRVQFCAACKMCLAVCPYGAISLEHIGMPGTGEDSETMAQRSRREVAVRCDMCEGWREKNGKKITACMEACPARALSMVEPDGTVILPPPPETKLDETSGSSKGTSDEKTDVTATAMPERKSALKTQPSETGQTDIRPAEERVPTAAKKRPAQKSTAAGKTKAKPRKAAP
jgi:carbon-monoxide dehydrogenase iron sulfur subunit